MVPLFPDGFDHPIDVFEGQLWFAAHGTPVNSASILPDTSAISYCRCDDTGLFHPTTRNVQAREAERWIEK